MEELKNWCEQNDIVFEVDGKIIEVPDEGAFIYLEGNGDILISNSESKREDDYYFDLTDEEYEIIYNFNIDKFVFQWGSRFYYCKKKELKNQYNEVVYSPDFNLFVNLGKVKSEIEIPFLNLGIHTGYELLNGTLEPKDWVKKAKFLSLDCIGICDKNTLGGTLAFQSECTSAGIKSILGETIDVAYNYDVEKDIQDTYELKLYCKNYKGWLNLLRVNKAINVDFDGFIPEEELFNYGEGLICVISRSSYFNRRIKSEVFKDRVEIYEYVFDDLFYQIDFSEFLDPDYDIENLERTKYYFENYFDLVKPIYIQDSYYTDKINSPVKSDLNKLAKVAQPESIDQYFKNLDQIFLKYLSLFENEETLNKFLESVGNTKVLGDQCNYMIDVGNHKLPKFEVEDPVSLYYEEITKGFEEKILSKGYSDKLIKKYLDRVEEENDVIVEAGFVDYFLILWDIVNWCKDNNILVGPGRGSAGGSLVAYLLGIIEIDPIEFDLLFERFLNKTRVSGERAKSADALPDIDIDFEGSKRQEVKRYMESKYGVSSVCSVGTYSRMKVKSALKDLGRVKGLKFDEINKATKMIPDSIKSFWKDIFDNAVKKKPLKSFVQDNIELIERIHGVLGQPRSRSIHASAVLILPKKDNFGNDMTVFDWIPVKKIDGNLVSEWEGKYVDKSGFLKEDILGIAQLDKFRSMVDLIKLHRGIDLDFNKIPKEDEKVFEYFRRGWNEDVFQFGTSGLKNYSKKVKPDHIEDLISMNALFRPGPMESGAHTDFYKIKHGLKKPKFDPFMKKVTKKTQGLYIFQEQVMQAMVVGGLTLSEADQVRTYMKKFDDQALSKFKEKFLNGYSKLFELEEEGLRVGNKVWDKLYAFSSYGFNRSHSAAYSLMGYWSQYLKVNFPIEFWTASLNFANEDSEIPNRLSEIAKINDASDDSDKINVRPPDINNSDRFFTCDVENREIYWSIEKIKHAGPVAVGCILEERDKNGKFYSLGDFYERVPKQKVNKRVVENLIISGCFDRIEYEDKDGEYDIVGEQINKRLYILYDYYRKSNNKIPDKYLDNRDLNKDWYWISEQKALTGFGEINFKLLLSQKTNSASIIKNFKTARDFGAWKDPNKKNRRMFDDGFPCTICGKIMFLFKKQDKNKDDYYKISIESNNSVIVITCWKDESERLGSKLEELEKSKQLFAITGGILFDDFRESNVLKLNNKSKIIKL